MKTLGFILLVVIGVSCTKEVIKPITEKEQVVITKTVIEVDTIWCDSIITVIDTVWQDSITIIKEIRNDTIIIRDTVYIYPEPIVIRDTVFINATVWQIHQDFKAYVEEFYLDAKRYRHSGLQKNNLILDYWYLNEINDPNATSYSEKVGYQWRAKINQILRNEYCYIPVYRELAHIILGKPYVYDDTMNIMYPYFSARSFTNRDYDSEIRKPYLDKLFSQ